MIRLLSAIILFAMCFPAIGTAQPLHKQFDYYFHMGKDQRDFLDTVQYRSFLYFLDHSDPGNGLVRDRSTVESPASMAATGFGVVVWAIGAENKWISRETAALRTYRLLKFLLNSEQSFDPLATGYMGFYYHFVDMKSGRRVWNCELSSIDTAWLIAGLLFARQYYTERSSTETEIREMVARVLDRIDWDWFTLKNGRDKGTISLGWTPGEAFHSKGWTGYNEALLLYIIAAGMGMDNYSDGYDKWVFQYRMAEPYEGLKHVWFPPMFGHQYSHMFIDFRGLYDQYMNDAGLDYFENSRRATLTQRLYAIDNPMDWKGYNENTWGLTACDGPGDSYNYGDRKFNYYAARGTSGPGMSHDDDGTIAPTAAGGSVVFAPEICVPALQNFYDKYGFRGLWGEYGFKDSFNPTLDWYANDYLGIDQAPFVIMIQNLKNSMVWRYTMKDPVISDGLRNLKFFYK